VTDVVETPRPARGPRPVFAWRHRQLAADLAALGRARQISRDSLIFAGHATEVATLGFDEVFTRMWTFYLSYSEAGFRAGYIDVSQLTLARI
jgi:Mycolic acid cyclopropane synthetase